MKGFPEGTSKTSIVQEAVRAGVAYRGYIEATIPAAVAGVPGSVYFELTLGNAETALFSRIVSSDRANVRYEVMSGAVVATRDSPTLIFNMNQKLASAPSKHVFRPCTVSSPGNTVDLDVVRGADGQGNRTTGSTFSPEDFRIYDRNQAIVVRALNPDAEAAQLLVYYKWFEFSWP